MAEHPFSPTLAASVPLQDLLRDLGERRAEIRRLQTLVDRLGELLLEAWKERDGDS